MQNNEWVNRLSQLQNMRLEVDELSQRIARLELTLKKETFAPGQERRAENSLRDALRRMNARRLDCMEELGRLYSSIDDIPDSKLRRIFSFRYIDGLTWQEVAYRIGEFDEQYPRRLHNRYLRQRSSEKNDKCG